MVTMITLHYLAKENREQAMELLKKNTELAENAKGLISRQVFISINDPLKGYSVTSWETMEDLESFRHNPERPKMEYEGDEKRIYGRGPQGRVLLFTQTDTDIYELEYSSTK